MALEDVGARLITEGEAQFLASMMKVQNAVHGVGEASDKSKGPMERLSAMSLTLANALGQAVYNAAMAAGRAVLNFATESITAASDLNETVSKVGVVFGDQAQKVVDFGKNAATSMGMSENAALTAAGTYGNLFRSMGMTNETSADMSMSLVKLAGDLASFNNQDPSEVLEKLRAGLTGESEPLKSLGININEDIIKQEALNMGLIKGKEKLTAAAKAQAVYALMLKQTSLAQGDFARTSEGMANQQRIFDANMENTKALLGSAFLPVVNMAMQGINALFANPAVQQGMQNFVQWVQGIISAFKEGFQFAEGGGFIGHVLDGVINVLSEANIGYDWVLDLQTWINKVPGIFATVFGQVMAVVQPALDILAGWWQENGYTVMTTLSSMWASVQQAFNSIVAAVMNIIAIISPMVQMFLTSMAQWWADNGVQIMATVQVLWAAVANLISAAAGLITAIVGFLVRNIMAFWTAHGAEIMTFLTGLWTFIIGLFTTVTQTVALIFEAFTALLNGDTEEFSAKMQQAWQFLWDAIRGAAEVAWAALSAWFQGIILAIIGFFSNTNWGQIGDNIIKGIWSGLSSGWSWLTEKVAELAAALFDAAKKALGIQSPSKAFESIGKNMMLGMAKGILDNAITPTIATNYAAQMAMGSAASVSAGPSITNISNSTSYNLSVMTSQSPQVVQRSFAMMKMLAA